MLTLILLGLSAIILAGGLIWTYQLGKTQKQHADNKIPSAISRHTVVLNPIFLALILFGVVVWIMILAADIIK
ncbi:hypothetical protein ACFFJY_13125 [Fictibacillus aquaticus]|uniref:Uncharacterized protein n=1 Tax=Fictibacillus aquaticus TaxID=2021314 RepID=A0A235FD92_9BACL|nr:hypothetical protein [Fictibacillus aquaticus]OYD59172.1 hypothetical protein CGZ90_04550 [Fictibacillus aquaticus]